MKTIVATLIVLGCVSQSVYAQAAAQEKKSILQKLFERMAKPKQRAQPFMRVAPVIPALPEADQELRNKRLTAFAGAYLGWVDMKCKLTDDQKTKLRAEVAKQVPRTPRAMMARNRPMTCDFGPITFPRAGAGDQFLANAAWRRVLEEELTESQKKSLKAAIEARDKWQKGELLNTPVGMLDQYLLLNEKQIPEFTSLMEEELLKDDILSATFGISNSTYPFQRTSIGRISMDSEKTREKLLALLGPARMRRMKALSGTTYQQAEQSVSFQMSQSDKWEDMLAKYTETQRERVMSMYAVRIQDLKERFDLSEKNVRKLSLLSKGSTSQVLEQWIESTNKNLDRNLKQYAGRGNISFGMSVPSLITVNRNKRWQSNVKKAVGGANTADDGRKKRYREWNARYALAVFDQELWLRSDQREFFRKMCEEVLDDPNWNDTYYRELTLVAEVLFRVPNEQKDALLDVNQKAAWDALKSTYREQGNIFYVRMPYGEGGFGFSKKRRKR